MDGNNAAYDMKSLGKHIEAVSQDAFSTLNQPFISVASVCLITELTISIYFGRCLRKVAT